MIDTPRTGVRRHVPTGTHMHRPVHRASHQSGVDHAATSKGKKTKGTPCGSAVQAVRADIGGSGPAVTEPEGCPDTLLGESIKPRETLSWREKGRKTELWQKPNPNFPGTEEGLWRAVRQALTGIARHEQSGEATGYSQGVSSNPFYD